MLLLVVLAPSLGHHPQKGGTELFLSHSWAGDQSDLVEHFQKVVVAHH